MGSLDEKDRNMHDNVETLLDANGWNNFGGAKGAAYSYMDGAQRTAYDEMIRLARDAKLDINAVFTPTFVIVAVAGAQGLNEQAQKIAALGVVQASIRITAAGIHLQYSDIDSILGSSILDQLGVSAKDYISGIKFSAIGATLAKVVKSASEILIVGQVLSIVLTLWAAIEGAQQREQLQEGIRDLSVTRFNMRLILNQTQAVVTYIGEMSVYIGLMAKRSFPVEDVVDNLQNYSGFTEITFERCLQILHTIDAGRTSWTEEDPDDQYIQTESPSGKLMNN
eukprot:TRINITY_DN13_c0_g1_i1.p1 TRINITY_DN13_c0_g1~~TRINITY_DN13_c0_g1_i1.p1  ORF type:complete len:309 (+),score=59.68 TRINITY_DN13_c0_g1_i1:86-928(+)